TDEERGLTAWAKEMSLEAIGATEHGDTYDFPVGMTFTRRWKWTQYLPFMPTYQAGKFTALFQRKKDS
ncbi:jg25811, partial [Pararge aegeria aegeria]